MASRFRRKNIDPSKALEVVRASERPDVVDEVDHFSREVPERPTGMEKEEEEVSFRCRQ